MDNQYSIIKFDDYERLGEENLKYPVKIEMNTEKRYKIFSYVGIFLVSCLFTMWIFAIILLIKGNGLIRTLVLIICVLQFTVKDGVYHYRKFLQWCKIQNYFDSYSIIFEEKLQKSKLLLCSQPHGIISIGMGMALFSGIPLLFDLVMCGTRFVRMLPLSGLFARMAGIQGVNNDNFKQLMKQEKNIVFVPGGFECASITNFSKDRVFIKSRKGFLKYALQYGYKVVPCYTFNENKVFYTINSSWLEFIGFYLNKIKIPGCFFYGKFLFFPRSEIHLCTVFGKAMEIPLIKNPTKTEVAYYHGLYLQNLEALFNRYKKEFNASDTLEMI
jgi:hypothetical protein